VQANPKVHKYQFHLAAQHLSVGNIHAAIGQPEEALRAYEQARDLAQRLFEQHPAVTEYVESLAKSLSNIAWLQAGRGRHAEALATYRTAQPHFEQIVRLRPQVPSYQFDLVLNHERIGHVQFAMGEFAAALVSYQTARAMLHELTAKHPAVVDYRKELLTCLECLGILHIRTGAAREAATVIAERAARDADNAAVLYSAANYLAQCVPLVGRGKTSLTDEERAQRQRYADQVIDLLRQAIGRGFKDVERLNKERAFDPLRAQDEFKKLLAELQKKQE